jgi:hypothetical protein
MNDDEKQFFQDVIDGLTAQRNAAQNEAVQLAAQVKKLMRENEALKKAQMAQTPTEGELLPPVPPAANNGHDAQAANLN